MSNTQKNWLCGAAGFIIALLLVWLCTRGSGQPVQPSITPVIVQVKTVDSAKAATDHYVQNLVALNDELFKTYKSNRSKIAQLQADARLMESVLNNMPVGHDSIITKYIAGNVIKDSLCDEALQNSTQRIQNDSSIIAAKDTLITVQRNQLRIAFNDKDAQGKFEKKQDKKIGNLKISNGIVKYTEAAVIVYLLYKLIKR